MPSRCQSVARAAAAGLAASLALAGWPATALDLQPVAGGLTAPIGLIDPADGSGRLFVLKQHGPVRVIGPDGTLAEEPLLAASLFGSILRIDLRRGFPCYAIPPGNPLAGGPGRDKFWAWGFRKPYRIALDRVTGDLLVTAPAETLWGAIYLVRGPANFRWPLLEGTRCLDRARPRDEAACDDPGPVLDGFRPERSVVKYPNMQVDPDSGGEAEGVGTAVTGARIYRGAAIPEPAGRLVFSDWSAALERPSGQIFVATPASRWGELWNDERVLEVDRRIVGLAEDGAGEIDMLTNDNLGPFGSTGRVLKLVPR